MHNEISTRKNRYKSKRVVTIIAANEGDFPVEQQHKEKVDVNNIIKKYQQNLPITHLNRNRGVYADLSLMTDYQGMLDAVSQAQKAFNDLPANLRSRFQNDPEQLLNFLQDSKNKEEAIKLGLINPTDPLNTNDQTNVNVEPVKTKKDQKASSTNSTPPKEE